MSDLTKTHQMRKWVYASWGAVLLFPLLLGITGLANIELGGKAMVEGAVLNTFIRSIFCSVAIALVFVGPYAVFIRPIFLKRTEVERVLTSLFFLGLPLGGYAYYEGSLKTAMDYHEWGLLVLPAIILGSVLYERTEKIWVFAVTVSLAFLYPLYFVNDLMAPFGTLLNTAAKSEWLYFWRTAGLTLIVGIIAACAPERADADKKREYRATVAALAVIWLVLEFVLPSAMQSMIAELKVPASHQWEWGLVVALFLSMVANREIGDLLALALSATLLVASSYSMIDLMQTFERDFWKLTWAVFHLMVLITAAKTFILMRANVIALRPLFRLKRA